MIQIINQSDFLWAISTSYKGSRSVPLEISLTPLKKPAGNTISIASDNFRKFGDGIKQEIADAIQSGIIQVNDLNDLHNAEERSILPESSTNIAAGNVTKMIQSAIDFKNIYNAHDASAVFHVAGPFGAYQITAADPTDLTTLLAFLGHANGPKAKYNVHRVDVANHTVVDSKNIVTYTTPVPTAAAAAAALKELWGLYRQHRRWAVYTATLNPLTVFTY